MSDLEVLFKKSSQIIFLCESKFMKLYLFEMTIRALFQIVERPYLIKLFKWNELDVTNPLQCLL